MKKVISAVLLAALLAAMLSLCACGKTERYTIGELTEDSWKSGFIGLRFDCPDGYEMASRENLDKLSVAEEASQTDASGAITVYEMQAAAQDGMPAVTVNVEKLSEDYTTLQYASSMAAKLSSLGVSGLQYTFGECEEVTFAGAKYTRMHVSVETGGMTVDQDYYLRRIGDRMVCVVFSYSDQYDASAQELMDAFKKY